MSQTRRRSFNQEFKLAAVQRMLAGANVSALAKELDVLRKDLYVWRELYRVGGVPALLPQRRGPKRKGQAVPLARPSSATAPPPPLPSGPVAPARPPDPLAAAQARIAELERKVGRQALELDFFQKALRHFETTRQPDDGLGVTASTRPSEP